MNRTFLRGVSAAAVVTLGMLPDMAEAQGPPPDPARRAELVKRFDADGDGKLNFAEMDALRAFMKTQSSRETRADGAVASSTEGAGTAPHHSPAKAGGEGHE